MIEAIHAELIPRPELISARRALFRMAAGILLDEVDLEDLDLEQDDIVDSPCLRFAIGEAMRGTWPIKGKIPHRRIGTHRELSWSSGNALRPRG